MEQLLEHVEEGVLLVAVVVAAQVEVVVVVVAVVVQQMDQVTIHGLDELQLES